MTPSTAVEEPALQLVARHAVIDVMSAYAAAVDRHDWAAVRACFDPAAYIQGTRMTGSFTEYFPHLREELEKFERTVHLLGNQRITVSGEQAWLETYAVARHFWRSADDAPQQLTIGVRYSDDLHRTTNSWAIIRRAVDLDWADTSAPGPGLTWSVFDADAARRDVP